MILNNYRYRSTLSISYTYIQYLVLYYFTNYYKFLKKHSFITITQILQLLARISECMFFHITFNV
jgi:hypothetical protein